MQGQVVVHDPGHAWQHHTHRSPCGSCRSCASTLTLDWDEGMMRTHLVWLNSRRRALCDTCSIEHGQHACSVQGQVHAAGAGPPLVP
jgi:hypothetical protein